MRIKPFWKVALILDFLLIVFALFQSSMWLLNTQIAFACSMLITFASFYAYKGMVTQKVEGGVVGDDDFDGLDKIEDPHGLYDEPVVDAIQEAELQEVKSDKIGFKQSMKNLFKSYKGALSGYRIASYLLMCVAILVLIRHELFMPMAFLIALAIVPVSSLIGLWFLENEENR